MELLEIIYNSLFYFIIVAAVVLVVAFTAHKTRKKLNLLPKEELAPELKPKLKTKNGKPIKHSSKKKVVAKSYSRPAKRKEEKINISTSAKRKKPDKLKDKEIPAPIRKKTTGRIEILNPQMPKSTNIKSTKIDLSKTSKDDLLKHYSDSEDDDLGTISPDK